MITPFEILELQHSWGGPAEPDRRQGSYVHALGGPYASAFFEGPTEPDRRQVSYDHALGGPYASCLLYTSPSPRDATLSRMPSSA